MMLQLKGKRLWGNVDGTAIIGPDATRDDQQKLDYMALRTQPMIVRELSKQVTSLVLRCDGPKAVWGRLVEEFEIKSV